MTIKNIIKAARLLESRGNGYGQGANERWSAYNKNGLTVEEKILFKKMLDCSTGAAISALCGDVPLDTSGAVYTGNEASLFRKTGLYRVLNYNTKKSIRKQAKKGGFLLTPYHHIVTVLDKGECLNAVANEKGKTTGGKPGDQTGREVRIDKLYIRPGGWKYNIVPIPAVEFKGRVLKYYVENEDYNKQLKLLNVWAPSDAPLYENFILDWTALDAGMEFGDGSDVPHDGHAFVVLGGTRPQMAERLQAGLPAFLANVNSKIIVSGGTVRKGETEAEYMASWLVDNGIDAERIIMEEKSYSTVGNAINSVDLMIKNQLYSFTLVSYASHLRRAMALFLAAILKRETAGKGSRSYGFAPTKCIAFKDKTVTEEPATQATREYIGGQVAYVLGLKNYYDKA